MNKIITITETASRAIEVFTRKNQMLRVAVKGGGCSGLSYDVKVDSITDKNDTIFEYDTFKVVVDNKSMIYIKGMELDYSTGIDGKGFQFKNPNAINTCGCGESFSIM
jgi:iron-sulfur cluster assembly protein|tara:strand:+ start:2165 stop:2488 length:324 start_codon:yes stop_codon:yes gene_type:complete